MWSAPHHSLWPNLSKWWPKRDGDCFLTVLCCTKWVPLKSPSWGCLAYWKVSLLLILAVVRQILLSPFQSTLPPLFFKIRAILNCQKWKQFSKTRTKFSSYFIEPFNWGGKKMNSFTFIFTSGKKYGIQVFCAKFWLEMIFYMQITDD